MMYLSRIFIILLFLNGFNSFSLAQWIENSEIILSVGSTKTFNLSPTKTVWIDHGKIIHGQSIGNQLQIKALLPGYSEMRVGEKSLKVHVLSHANIELYHRLKKITDSLIGLDVKLSNGQIIITGQLYSPTDLDKLSQAYVDDSYYEIKALIPSEFQKSIQNKLNSLLQKNAISPQNILFGDTLEIEASKSDIHEKKFKDIFHRYGIKTTEKIESIDISPLVKVEITVTEVRKDSSMSYGIEWPNSLAATLLPKFQTDSGSQLGFLKMLEQTGDGKILASPSLLCRSGKEAEFLAGGEFPIQVGSGRHGKNVVWRKYGVLLKVKPLADRTGRMSIALDTEVSTIDPSHIVDGIPGLLTHRISSHFDLRKPQTIALSGLIKKNEGSSSIGVPGLSQIPIIGSLFSSKDFLSNQTELIIFVRPSIVQETDLASKEPIND